MLSLVGAIQLTLRATRGGLAHRLGTGLRAPAAFGLCRCRGLALAQPARASVPALLIEDGECLIDSAAILDHLDERVGPRRALLPAAGAARRDALKTVALATGILRQGGSQRLRKPARGQQARPRLDRALPRPNRGWPWRPRPSLGTPNLAGARAAATGDQCWGDAGFCSALCAQAAPVGRYPALDWLAAWAGAQPAFMACRPSIAELGGPPKAARAALLRLQGSAQSR